MTVTVCYLSFMSQLHSGNQILFNNTISTRVFYTLNDRIHTSKFSRSAGAREFDIVLYDNRRVDSFKRVVWVGVMNIKCQTIKTCCINLNKVLSLSLSCFNGTSQTLKVSKVYFCFTKNVKLVTTSKLNCNENIYLLIFHIITVINVLFEYKQV